MFVSQLGTEGPDDGQFSAPYDVGVAPDGSVYVVDTGHNQIQKFTSTGVFVTKWGTYGAGDGQFYSPYGIAVASDGSVYVADTANHRIQKFTSAGVFISQSQWGTLGAGSFRRGDGQFDEPGGIAVASDGSVYVVGLNNHRIQKFSLGQ